MILKTSLTTLVVAALLAAGLRAQQPSTPSAQQASGKPGVVSLIGCVDRVPATSAGRGTTTPVPQTPAYRLIDVQPGTGTATTLKPNSQFLLAVATSVTTPIDLGKFQNQGVEVTGTMTPAPPAKVAAQPTVRPPAESATAQLPTLTTTAVKVVSTECK